MAAGSGIANGSEQLVVMIASPKGYGGQSTWSNVLLHDVSGDALRGAIQTLRK
jgi:hypothetical protein